MKAATSLYSLLCVVLIRKGDRRTKEHGLNERKTASFVHRKREQLYLNAIDLGQIRRDNY
jgi:hypothetical protein